METFITLPSPSGGFNVTFPPSLLQATSLESHQKWPSRRGWISKLHVISKLHYKYHSTEPKQCVRCGFSDPAIFSSCRYLSKQRQDIGPTIQLSCPSMPFLYPEAGESGPIARAQAVSTPNVLCQPSSGTPDSSFHTTNSPAHPPRAHKLRFFDVRGPEYGPYSPWRFRLVDQQPASGLLDLGILVPSSAILPLAMLEPKYSMVP